MKDLPKVTRGNISENINNTQDIYYGSDRTINKKDDLSIVKLKKKLLLVKQVLI